MNITIIIHFSHLLRHDPYLKEFLMLPPDATSEQVADKLKKNPQHVNWFFLKKFNIFRSHFIEKILKASREKGGWFFNRYEWQHRGAIHVHGLCRVGGNAPDTYNLARQIIDGHRITVENKAPYTPVQIELIRLGEEAKEKLIAFHDAYICADIDEPYDQFVPPNRRVPPSSQPMQLKYNQINNHYQDKLDLSIMLQRHVCRSGICLKIKNGQQNCRFNFPKEHSEKTTITVVQEKSNTQSPRYKIEINAKRHNDQRIVNHNHYQLQHWRANCDLSLLFDLTRVVKYVNKYATKAEKRSSVFNSAFKSVFSENNLEGIDTKASLRKVMTKILGERDVSLHEALHLLLGNNINIILFHQP